MDGFKLTPGATGGIGSILNTAGGFMAGNASRRAGQATQSELNYEAAQLNQNAGQQIAAAQRAAMESRRKSTLLVSRGIATAGASGGGVTDPTVAKLLADITGEGAYRAGVDLYQGEERARSMRMAAAGKTISGEVAAQGGENRANAYLMSAAGNGATTLFSKYGRGGFNKKTAIAQDWSSIDNMDTSSIDWDK